MRFLFPMGATLIAAISAAEAAPRVVADIAPVQSLVAHVMGDSADPALIVTPGASPHGITLRPRQAQSLTEADIVFTVGEDLVPWLLEAAPTLAPNAVIVELGELPGLSHVALREGGVFGDDDHDDHDHGHGDPHYWLDPRNAAVWADAIAEALAAVDPQKAATYRANAADLKTRLTKLEAEINALLAPVRGRPYVVFHDAWGHFEHRFDMPATGAVALSDAARPGPARIAEIQAYLRATEAACVFAEPQFPRRLLDLVTEGSSARIAVLDPLGRPGRGSYSAMMRENAGKIRDCLDR